jgi:hypothetical protein
MSEMVGLAEIAQRLRLDLRSVRRLLAKEGDALKIELVRGKGDKLLLSRDDADKLIMFSWCLRRFQIGSRSVLRTTWRGD